METPDKMRYPKADTASTGLVSPERNRRTPYQPRLSQNLKGHYKFLGFKA